MKFLFSLIIFLSSFSIFAVQEAKISGVVNLSNNLASKLNTNGILFVFAKKANPNGGASFGQPPMAVVKIPNPKFPQRFILSSQNVMMTGTKFEGPVTITARYSPMGNPMSTPDSLEGYDISHPIINIGASNISINLKEQNANKRNNEIKIPMH